MACRDMFFKLNMGGSFRLKKAEIVVLLVLCLFSQNLTAEAQEKVDKLIEQLHGKAAYYDQKGEPLGFFASWTIRHYEEATRIYSAKLLPGLVTPANKEKILNALLVALEHGSDDRDTGDGIILNRTEIAFALARWGDERAVRPLLRVLTSREKLPMINAKAGPAEIKLKNSSSNLNIITALGTFRGSEADFAASMMELILVTPQPPQIEKQLRDAVDMIRNGSDSPIEMLLVPQRP